MVISDKVSCNDRKDCRFIVGYQADGNWYHCLSRHLKIYLVMVCHNTIKTLPIQRHSMFLREWMSQYKNIWNGVESQLFEKLATEPIKREGKYVHGNLKTWKECVKSNFHGQDVPHDMYCSATAVLKIDPLYKEGKNYHPQVYVEECRYTNAENQQCNMLSDDDDDGLFEV